MASNSAHPSHVLPIFRDTVSSDTGHYFCDQRPFALPRTGNRVSILDNGKDVLSDIHTAMLSASSFIWLADWQMAWDVELGNRDHPERPGRLHNVIQWIISTKPVHIRILLYRSPADSAVGTYDGLVMQRIMALNRSRYPGSVRVLLQSATSNQNDWFDYSHHQKFVVIDGETGYLGGVDLSYGRWETSNFDVVIDPENYVINDMYNPCVKKMRRTSSLENKKIATWRFEPPYGGLLIDEGCQPRMPWQDVHIKIVGPSVVDIHRNFVRRWNSTIKSVPFPPRGSINPAPITRQWLSEIGAWQRLISTQAHRSSGTQVQIVRSVSSKHLKMEKRSVDDLHLYGHKESSMWRRSLDAWENEHQPNILDAMVKCIRSADNYIYIETQFFISQFGTRDGRGGKGQGNENNGIENTLVEELGNRIESHIQAKGRPPFHVYLVIPVCPEGDLSQDQTWKQHRLAQASIKHGTQSLIERIIRSLRLTRRSQSDWTQYLTILNMRSYGATVMYARDPETFDEDFDREIGRYAITEQVYIHSKLLIVDDAVAIVGSANINDRSLTGNGDTEIAAVIVDTEGVELRDLGSPNFKVQTRKFARELRMRLWEKHFGFKIEVDAYFRATTRAIRANKAIPHLLPHPPRYQTTEARIKALTGAHWKQILEQPCLPESVGAIQKIAANNTRVFEGVFIHTPRNSIGTFDRTVEILHETPPYAAAYNALGTTDYHFTVPSNYPEKFRGVLPPPLQPEFMTTEFLPHQRKTTDHRSYTHRQQTFENFKIHDVDKAIAHLRNHILGFFVLAPLDWGQHQSINDDPTKGTGAEVDVAAFDQPSTTKGTSA